ncbi:lipid A deacylase LpxR family protein [Longimicrobium sp.]|uniref:lipid A deacylase LpxR family protein n=1 Tax=Longimicrobium sp. TaxID=2029185 RepID=UPI002B677DBB|nr:lipid A deacylase LpxR family protein [Longimicrobium sp.]HSU14871.1 lipid A deacylase LpxR family protein [Longimicrobium sp.]
MNGISPLRGPGRAVLAFVLALAAAPAPAQVRATRLALDNDAYDFWIPAATRPDWDYTNGIEMSVELAGGPLWARRVAPHAPRCAGAGPPDTACAATTLAFGQKLYTPRQDGPDPVPGERPYAGWLYLSATGRVATTARQRSIGVEVGVTGPPSLGKAVHMGWHRIAGFRPPQGWDNQLRFEPGVILRYDESLLAALRAGDVRVATLEPEWGADAGNVHVGAHAGVALRAGYAVPHPWSRAADAGAGPVSIYALAGVREDAVARDLFLDGHGGSPRVRREPFVWQRELGAGAHVAGVTLEYRATTQARQYRTASGPHTWSSFELTYRVR